MGVINLRAQEKIRIVKVYFELVTLIIKKLTIALIPILGMFMFIIGLQEAGINDTSVLFITIGLSITLLGIIILFNLD